MPAVEFAQWVGITLPPSRSYQTVAGFLLQEFGTIPSIGDKIEVDGWRFEIVDLDGRRIDKMMASRLEAA
jgi:putative hemolysin